ncbi:unnamed protein product [Adineta steineri]|uniref:Uncharacterized protein n=1 Tax=Adineta steineri TaxID=433720 RepID=A0A813SS93_9BILA|nr:unnamed protein product [Adineta steineri]CAF4040944.1 unnamed protein product [Adineta steineri]
MNSIGAVLKIEIDSKYRKQIIGDINASIRIPFTFSDLSKPELTIIRIDESKENRETLDLFQSSGTFLLRQTIRNDTGLYHLQATNESGTATSRLDILIRTVPLPPGASLQISDSGNDYVSLAWHTCPDDGGSYITSYFC